MNVLSAEWHLITGEYPPQPGGVSDYSELVASALAARGDSVHVWCSGEERRPWGELPSLALQASIPSLKPEAQAKDRASRVTVHRALGHFSRNDFFRAGRMLNEFRRPRRLLVQWVPHAFGYQSMNVGFCAWLLDRAGHHGDQIDLMVHEPFLDFRRNAWKQNAAALVHRFMTWCLLKAAHRVWVATPEWANCWRRYAGRRPIPFAWLPVPSNVSVVSDPDGAAALRAIYARSRSDFVVGHFGTYGRHIAPLLLAILPRVAEEHPNLMVLLMGRGSERFREELIRQHPKLHGRTFAKPDLSRAALSGHLSVCDLMIQPYPDGVSSRRGSIMAALAHGLPIITTKGRLTEPLWETSDAVALCPVNDNAAMVRAVGRLALDDSARIRLQTAARALYDDRFDIRHTVERLRSSLALQASSTLKPEAQAKERLRNAA